MIRASQLSGRAVVDIEAAEKLGQIDKVIVDPDARRVAAYVLTRGGAFSGERGEMVLPATSVHAIGPDAVTVRNAEAAPGGPSAFDALPRVSDIVGRKIVSRDGRLLGAVEDVLISGADGVIVGYEIADASGFGLFGARKRAGRPYLRADADLRSGRDLIVAPDDALSEWPEEQVVHPEPAIVGPVTRTEETNAADNRSDRFRDDDSVRPVAPPPGVLP